MKGSNKVIEALNSLLADELTAINQYIVHAEMNKNWGYTKLHDYFEARAITEMKHASMLIARIIFLEGTPIVSNLRAINIGANITEQLDNDHKSEFSAIKSYNAAIKLAEEEKDNVTRNLLEMIVKDEDTHIDAIEAYKDQINQMGAGIFFSTQTA